MGLTDDNDVMTNEIHRKRERKERERNCVCVCVRFFYFVAKEQNKKEERKTWLIDPRMHLLFVWVVRRRQIESILRIFVVL